MRILRTDYLTYFGFNIVRLFPCAITSRSVYDLQMILFEILLCKGLMKTRPCNFIGHFSKESGPYLEGIVVCEKVI